MAEVKGLTYMAEIYDEIFKYAPLNAESRALEVGIGFGQATAPILATGASVTALEPNEDVANVCKEIFAENKNLTVMTEKFEDFTAENESFHPDPMCCTTEQIDQSIRPCRPNPNEVFRRAVPSYQTIVPVHVSHPDRQ